MANINKLLFIVFILTFTHLAFSNADHGGSHESNADASQYTLTIKKVEMCTGTSSGSCDGAVTVGEETKAMDIASVDIGLAVAEYGSPTLLPLGETYTHMRTTMDRTFTVSTSSGIVVPSSREGADDLTCNAKLVTDTNYAGHGGTDEATAKYTHVPIMTPGGSLSTTEVRMMNATVSRICGTDTCSAGQDDVSWTTYGVVSNPGSGKAVYKQVSGDDFILIHELSVPFTVSLITPQIDIAFGTSNTINVVSMNAGTTDYCRFDALEPVVTITIQ